MLSQRRSSTSRFYHPSLLGTVEALTDASGDPTDTYVSTALGVSTAASGSTTNPFRFVGRLGYYTDPNGHLYVRARYYRPNTGSWLSADPVPTEPRYQYVGGNPVGRVDPGGTYTIGASCDGFETDVINAAWAMLVEPADLAGCMGWDTRGWFQEAMGQVVIECDHGGQGGPRDDNPNTCGWTPSDGSIALCWNAGPGCMSAIGCTIFHELVHMAVAAAWRLHPNPEESERQAWQCEFSCLRAKNCAPWWDPETGNTGNAPPHVCAKCCGYLPDVWPNVRPEPGPKSPRICDLTGVLCRLLCMNNEIANEPAVTRSPVLHPAGGGSRPVR